MKRDRKPLQRPLVIIGGYFDVFNYNRNLTRNRLREAIEDRRIVLVSVAGEKSMAGLRKRLIAAVDKRFPTDDPNFTIEVDVVAHSMGGLISRYAAAPSDDPSQPRRLKIVRLFTISTPHTGSDYARLGVTRFQKDLAPGSAFIKSLDADYPDANYKLIPYVLLGDSFVGTAHTAPPGQSPYWLASSALFRHPTAMSDRRFLADIARRLRGETPLTISGPSPLPE